jgi:hypothetical protein
LVPLVEEADQVTAANLLLQVLPCAVGRAIVHDDDLLLELERRGLSDAIQQRLDGRHLVEHRNHDRERLDGLPLLT